MGSSNLAIVADGVRKRFGDNYALDGFNLEVPQGTVCGLLGPNGAGKTTSVRILATLQRLDEGRANVAGFDVSTQAAQVRYRIGLVSQHPAVDEILSGHQNLVMFGKLYRLGASGARRRAEELLDQFGLSDAGSKSVKSYSGGMRRRLDLAAGMIIAPSVLFLDEPTVGLDPRGRNEVWESVRALVAAGTTVLLTTQYLEEADQLADQISVIDSGRVIASGSPDQLKSKLGGDRVDLVTHDAADLPLAARIVEGVTGGAAEIDQDTRKLSSPITNRSVTLTDVIRALDAAGVHTEDIALRRPTLDEVFLHLTGRRPTEDAATEAAKTGRKKKKSDESPAETDSSARR